ncbi:MAG: hypothetical protein ACHQRM_02680 [Bacteroidia bacterium]
MHPSPHASDFAFGLSPDSILNHYNLLDSLEKPNIKLYAGAGLTDSIYLVVTSGQKISAYALCDNYSFITDGMLDTLPSESGHSQLLKVTISKELHSLNSGFALYSTEIKVIDPGSFHILFTCIPTQGSCGLVPPEVDSIPGSNEDEEICKGYDYTIRFKGRHIITDSLIGNADPDIPMGTYTFNGKEYKLTKKTLSLAERISGTWISTQDSNVVEVFKDWSIYTSYAHKAGDTLEYELSYESCDEDYGAVGSSEFLIKNDEAGSYCYEIMTLTENKMSLRYTTRGNILTYRRKH